MGTLPSYLRLGVLMLACAAPGQAYAFMEDTQLLDLRTGNPMSSSVQAYGDRGYELSDGTQLRFGDWYRPDVPEVNIRFLTMVRPDLGLIWGFGTGEEGGQYEIQPSLHLGVVTEREVSPSERLSLSVTGVIGGNLGERPCVAGYGDLGGTRTVNCRLAATTMRPAETLNYLFDESPTDRLRVSIGYRLEF